MDNKRVKKCYIYTRVSTAVQVDGFSLDAQRDRLIKYAKDNGYTVVKKYKDSAKSATTANRPAFQEMIADSSKKEFAYVIVHKLDRFSRDRYDSVTQKRKLKQNGVTLLSVTENINDSPESIMMESVLEGMAEYYSKNLAREVMKGQKETAYQCKHCGGKPPLGYDVDKETQKYIINEKEAAIIKMIFQMYLEGNGFQQILKYLNGNGYTSKNQKQFTQSSLNCILKNEKYNGTFVFNKKKEKDAMGKRNPKAKPEEEVIRVENGMPAIIDKQTFEKVQQKMIENKKRAGSFKAKHMYILSGMIFCGECGQPMFGNFRKGGRHKLPYASYRCGNRKSHKGCCNKEIRREYVEDFVLESLQKVLFAPKASKQIVKLMKEYHKTTLKQQQQELKQLKSALERTEKGLSNIIETIAIAGIPSDTLMDKLKQLEESKTQQKERIAELEKSIKNINIDENTIQNLIEHSREFIMTKNLPICKNILKEYINKVVVYMDKVEIYFKLNIIEQQELSVVSLPMTAEEDIDTIKREYKSLLKQ